MADINVKMGVSGISQFKQAMTDAQSSVKNYSAALKMNEAQLKATGDKETYLQNKTTALNAQISAQKRVVDNARAAYEQLISSGADPMSKAVVDMQTKFYNANTELINMTESLKDLESGEKSAATQTSNLTTSINNIGKKVSLEAVITGIDKVTGALESAGKKAIEVGEQIWNVILQTAQLSDDYATGATQYGIDVETYQKMLKVFDTSADTTIDAYFKARTKIQTAVNKGEKLDVFEALGVKTTEDGGSFSSESGSDIVNEAKGLARHWEDVFWEVGEQLRAKVESGELTQDLADTYANELFGKSWTELNPIFELGKEGFQEAVDAQTAATEEAVDNNAALNDSVIKLKEDWQTFQIEVLGAIAPELTKVTDSLSGMVNSFTEWAQSDEGQEMLTKLADAVGSLFSNLTSMDPQEVVGTLTGAIESLNGALEWVADNSGLVVGGIEAIIGVLAAGKIVSAISNVVLLANGIKGLKTPSNGGTNTGTDTTTNAVTQAGATTFLQNAGNFITNASGYISQHAGNIMTGMWNTAPLWDMFTNQTETGRAIRDGENLADIAETAGNELQNFGNTVKENASTFWDDWGQVFDNLFYGGKNGPEGDNGDTRNFFERGWETYLQNASGTTNLFQNIWKGMTGNLQIAAANTFGDENNTEDLMGMLFGEKEPVPVEVEPEIPEDWYLGDEPSIEDALEMLFGEAEPEVTVEPVTEENAAEDLAAQIGTVEVPVKLVVSGTGGGFASYVWAADGGGFNLRYKSHANGLDYVPFDGYPALLHKGERVVTAREANSNSYNSNLYVESMYMNNGTDAQALAAAMAAANRRTRAGYGS